MAKQKSHKSYQFPGQHPDEEVELVFRQHPIVMRKTLIVFLVVLLIGAIPLQFAPLEKWPWWSLLGGFAVGLIIFGYRMIGWFFSVYIVTSERLIQIFQKGFFNRKVVDISHNKIQSVNYEVKGIQATMFGFGTIVVQTYVGDLVLPFIHKPERVHQLMVKQMRVSSPQTPPELGKAENSK